MDRTLTVEQRAELARAVMCQDFEEDGDCARTPSGYNYNGDRYGGNVWNPGYDPDQWQKLIEWMCKYVQSRPLAIMGSERHILDQMAEHVSKSDAEALELLAHSLITGEEK